MLIFSVPLIIHSNIKVGSGYSKKELAEFNKKLADHWKVFNKKNPPSSIILASGFKEKPDAYIEPENSCIVQVRDYCRCLANVPHFCKSKGY